MPDHVLAVGPSGRKRLVPPRWLDLDLGFRRPPSAKKKNRPEPPVEQPTESPLAAEPTAEPETKE